MTTRTFEAAAAAFLGLQRIAVAGVSRSGNATGNALLKALQARGCEAIPVNPHAGTIEGQPCYPNVRSIPGGVDGVLIVTPPEAVAQVVVDAAAAGARYIWMHDNTLLPGSVSAEGIETGRMAGLTVIAGGCPLMFLDFGHRCMKWMLGAVHRLPPPVYNFSEN